VHELDLFLCLPLSLLSRDGAGAGRHEFRGAAVSMGRWPAASTEPAAVTVSSGTLWDMSGHGAGIAIPLFNLHIVLRIGGISMSWFV